MGSVLGAFLKASGDAVLPYVEGLMPRIAPLLDKARPEEERRIALCVVDDMLEHSAAGRAKYLSQVGVGETATCTASDSQPKTRPAVPPYNSMLPLPNNTTHKQTRTISLITVCCLCVSMC